MRLLLPTTLEESQADTSWHGSAVTLFLAFRQEMNLSIVRGEVKCAEAITQEAKPCENVRGFLLTGSLVGTQTCLSFQMCGLTHSPWANSPHPYLPASYSPARPSCPTRGKLIHGVIPMIDHMVAAMSKHLEEKPSQIAFVSKAIQHECSSTNLLIPLILIIQYMTVSINI